MAHTTADPELPTNSEQFFFSCPCLNLQVIARKPKDTELPDGRAALKGHSKEQRVWLGDRSELTKQPAYVSWDQDTFRPGRKQTVESSDPFADELGPSNRTCWLCQTKCYKASGKEQSSPAVTNDWVEVDLSSGVIWGKELDNLLDSNNTLPFSSVNLPLSGSTSIFGRPPQTCTPTPYPSVDSGEPESSSLVPPIPDPFFLPPPFIPSHPHLRDLCAAAVSHLNERHAQLEQEVQSFISQKSHEMRKLEDDVRNEVELLWTKYANVPGKKEEIERSRSTSSGRDVDRDGQRRRESVSRFMPPTTNSTTAVNPSSDTALTSPPSTSSGSLLAASLSANTFHAPPPPPPQLFDKVDDSILNLSHTVKNLDDRAVAMSHVFSVLDDAMADRNEKGIRKMRTSAARTKEDVNQADMQAASELVADGENQKDSWIDEERRLLAQKDIPGDNTEDGETPKAPAKPLPEEKTKEKRAVKFEEPKKDANDRQEASSDDEDTEVVQGGRDQDEYVFDFELEDGEHTNGTESTSDTQIYHQREKSRTRNMVEANLSRTFAADAPSHRAAWRRIEQNSSIYASLRRSASGNDDTESEDSGISKLATSMPLEIVMARNKHVQPSLPARERKTSFSENGPELVPPLIAAMRQRGLGENALGLSPSRPTRRDLPRNSHRTASASRDRERDQARSYAADPGAVFETLADDGEEEDASDEEEVGTLKENKGFVPPHVLVRRKDSESGPEVGWRSLAS